MNAGPRNGSTARSPRCWPLSERSAALSTRSSPGRAFSTPSTCFSIRGGAAGLGRSVSTAAVTYLLNENRASQAERNVHAPAFDANADGAFELALAHDLEACTGQQAAPVELAQADRVVVRSTLHGNLLPHSACAQRAVAERAHLAGERRDGVAVRGALPAAEQSEDPLLHPFGNHMLEALRLVVDLVPAVAEDLDEEHLQEAVVPDELERHLAALTRELLAPVAVVLDETLGSESRDHLADAGRGDAQALGELAGRNRGLIPVQLVEGFEVILLGSGEVAASLEPVDHRA